MACFDAALRQQKTRPIPERLWWTLFVLVPIAYNPVSRWQYEPDKVALILVLVGALLGLSILWGLPQAESSRAERWLTLTLGVRWLASSASVLPAWSLWGDPAWRNGLWFDLAMLVLFVLARRQLVLPECRMRIVDAILIGSAVVAVYGVLQVVGLDPLAETDFVRVPSTLAHPNLLAAYLAMVLPLTSVRCILAFLDKVCSCAERTALAGLFAVQVLCLVFTYSRAGWLAAMVGLLVTFTALYWAFGHRAVARALGAISLAGGLGLMGLSLMPPLPGAAPHVLQTLTSLFRWRGATAQIRLLAWQASFKALYDRPWLGYGPATFSAVLPRYLPPALVPFGGAGALGGRPHNVYLEMALESGVLGLACFGLALVALFRPLVRQLAAGSGAKQERLLLAALVGALTANLVTYGFSFESATTALLFWTMAGLGHGRVQPAAASGRFQPKRPIFASLIIVGCALLGVWSTAPDVLAFLGESLAASGYYGPAIAVLDQAVALAPIPEVFLGIESKIYAEWAEKVGAETLWERGDALHARRVHLQPHSAPYWQQWGDYLRRWHHAEARPGVALRSVAAFSEALRLSPTDVDLWLDRGLARLEAGQTDSALADFSHAHALLPDYTRYYGTMSVYTLHRGDEVEAAEWQARALGAQDAWDAWVWRR